jgi:hypothetical protein
MGVQAKAKKLKITLAPREDMILRQRPSRQNDIMIATISGLLAWTITLALRAAFGG